MKCSLVYQAGIFFSTSIFCEKLILADKSRLKKFMVCRKSPLKKLTTLSAFTPASMSRQIKQPAARFEKGVWMNTVTTSYKHNGVPVSIPRGSYGVTRLTARLYEYPKGHPCRGCPFTLRTSVPSCMFPSRKDGGCLWYDLKRKKRPPLPHTYPQNQAAAERIFDFIEVLKKVMKQKGYS